MNPERNAREILRSLNTKKMVPLEFELLEQKKTPHKKSSPLRKEIKKPIEIRSRALNNEPLNP
jgi:hypothetical protein